MQQNFLFVIVNPKFLFEKQICFDLNPFIFKPKTAYFESCSCYIHGLYHLLSLLNFSLTNFRWSHNDLRVVGCDHAKMEDIFSRSATTTLQEIYMKILANLELEMPKLILLPYHNLKPFWRVVNDHPNSNYISKIYIKRLAQTYTLPSWRNYLSKFERLIGNWFS